MKEVTKLGRIKNKIFEPRGLLEKRSGSGRRSVFVSRSDSFAASAMRRFSQPAEPSCQI